MAASKQLFTQSSCNVTENKVEYNATTNFSIPCHLTVRRHAVEKASLNNPRNDKAAYLFPSL